MKGRGKPKMMKKTGKLQPIMHGQQKVPGYAIASGSAVRKKKGVNR